MSCAQNPPFWPWAVKCVVFAKDLAEIDGQRKDGKMTGVRAAQGCCRWYICCLQVRGVVHCGVERAGGERHPQTQWKEASFRVYHLFH